MAAAVLGKRVASHGKMKCVCCEEVVGTDDVVEHLLSSHPPKELALSLLQAHGIKHAEEPPAKMRKLQDNSELVAGFMQRLDNILAVEPQAGTGLAERMEMLIARAQVVKKAFTEVTIHNLPDTVLLQIFGHFEEICLRDVIGRVCQRWSELACDRSLWAQFCLSFPLQKGDYSSGEGKKFIRLLKNSPYIHTLDLNLGPKRGVEDPDGVVQALYRSNPPVKSLKLLFNPPYRTLIHIIQAKKHTIEELAVRLCPKEFENQTGKIPVVGFWAVVKQLKLKSVSVFPQLLLGKVNFEVSRSKLTCLNRLIVTVTEPGMAVSRASFEKSNMLSSLISVNSATLQVVHLPDNVASRDVMALGQCPNLEEVRVSWSDDLTVLNSCSKLKRLDVSWRVESRDVPKIVSFFKSSPMSAKLEALGLYGMGPPMLSPSDLKDFFKPFICLKTLVLNNWGLKIEYLTAIVEGVKQMPKLRALHVDKYKCIDYCVFRPLIAVKNRLPDIDIQLEKCNCSLSIMLNLMEAIGLNDSFSDYDEYDASSVDLFASDSEYDGFSDQDSDQHSDSHSEANPDSDSENGDWP